MAKTKFLIFILIICQLARIVEVKVATKSAAKGVIPYNDIGS